MHYTVTEFCRIAGFSRQTLYNMWWDRNGPPREKTGDGQTCRVLIPANAGLQWLAGYKREHGHG